VDVKLIDIRCACGKLLGRVQEGAAHEIKCPRCKNVVYRGMILQMRPTKEEIKEEIKEDIKLYFLGNYIHDSL
jgi:phage FluMu protein Com